MTTPGWGQRRGTGGAETGEAETGRAGFLMEARPFTLLSVAGVGDGERSALAGILVGCGVVHGDRQAGPWSARDDVDADRGGAAEHVVARRAARSGVGGVHGHPGGLHTCD